MVWTIPNVFIAGTKAKANEVNENFTSIKQFVDVLETDNAQNTLDIQQLEENKANLNGDNAQRFQVADATNTYDAVNLQTLQEYTRNSRDTIDGFLLSKFNDNTISATAGACYDSTYEYMIVSDISLSVTQENLGDNATYYVYVCADKETSSNQLVISLSSTTPELPTDYDYYRRLGYFTTSSSGTISRVYSDSQINIPSYEAIQGGNFILPNGIKFWWYRIDGTWNTNQEFDISIGTFFEKAIFNVQATPSYAHANGDWDRANVGAYVSGTNTVHITIGRNWGGNIYILCIGV